MVPCNEKDQGALLMFKHGVIDRYDNLSSWSTKKDCCSWNGVLCNNITGRVTHLLLEDSYLAGEINLSSLLQLEFLNFLDLNNNEFEAISVDNNNVTSFATNLEHLDVSHNQMKGSFPNLIGQQKNLKQLYLSNNQLRGSILDLLSQHKNLEYLDLSSNHFSGSIPEQFSQNNKHLKSLDLSNNMFSGSILSTLGNLSSLRELSIGSNSFSGTISETFFSKLSQLDTLDLSNSTFEFHFDPEWIPPFQLTQLFLANTKLGPYFPSWIYTQKSLRGLDASSSRVSIVDEDKFWTLVEQCSLFFMSNNSINLHLSNLTLSTGVLRLDHNNFTGNLPHLSPIALYIDLSYNSFSGSIPKDWENSPYLFYIDLWSNALSGEIKLNFSKMSLLKSLNLGKNEFSGTIPSDFPNRLAMVVLRSNKFEGEIPSELFNLPSLFHLDLAHNKLSGPMPKSTYNVTKMIADNYYGLEGMFDYDTVDLFTKGHDYDYRINTNMINIDFSANNLSGEIPSGLFRLIQVQSLNLSYNRFTGTIKNAIGGMKKLESLDLSNNMFYGEIPQSMTLLTFLGYLNLSCNDFSGEIPTGTQLQSFDASSYVGNPKLCGAPLGKCDHGTIEEQHTRNEDDDDDFIERKSLYLGIGVGFAVSFWCICGSFVLNQKWRHTHYQFLDQIADQLYVKLMVKINRFRKIEAS
ncbi:hypothetical protein PIB30_046239 [Stylosanthes scabra]|uniref:Leucine-rich repeat-containing N-terminal plant-type domain-containing protein n=1 Tax=Stylosanthes scabra TaxID=79078 RepID=A0ABU6UJP3_9FABA|nr:hypothetical protein [Stylosanthes scabra]